MSVLFWWFNAMVTPDPIPNSAVKHRSGDGTRKGRVARRQNKVLDLKNINNRWYFFVSDLSLGSPRSHIIFC